MEIFLIIVQAIIVILAGYNEVLLGAKKEMIRSILINTSLILIILSFILSSWIFGLYFVGGTILWAIITTPLVKYMGFKSMGYHVTNDSLSFETKQRRIYRAKIKALKNTNIINILKEYNKNIEDLSVYETILMDTYPNIIKNPVKLKKLLEYEKEGLSHTVIAYHMENIY